MSPSERGPERPRRMDYSTIPRATFSDPEVAGVGMTEDRPGPSSRLPGLPGPVRRGRPRPDRRPDRGLRQSRGDAHRPDPGATIVGPDASLVIQEFTLAIEKGLGTRRHRRGHAHLSDVCRRRTRAGQPVRRDATRARFHPDGVEGLLWIHAVPRRATGQPTPPPKEPAGTNRKRSMRRPARAMDTDRPASASWGADTLHT